MWLESPISDMYNVMLCGKHNHTSKCTRSRLLNVDLHKVLFQLKQTTPSPSSRPPALTRQHQLLLSHIFTSLWGDRNAGNSQPNLALQLFFQSSWQAGTSASNCAPVSAPVPQNGLLACQAKAGKRDLMTEKRRNLEWEATLVWVVHIKTLSWNT